MAFTAEDLIIVKRDGGELSRDAIQWLIRAYTEGRVPDYQMSAMAMAILFNGMTTRELSVWTSAMLHSGDVLDFSDVPLPKVDKHSTGGVGDKISIPLAPLVAACGVAVPMMSGRGLAHTGGTLDKLEAIPGFATGLERARFKQILAEHGIVMAGASEEIVPADRKLYALRDATGTVPSIPLIASSIMSKKLAEGLDGLLLDVKTGSGAAMVQLEDSIELARTMVAVGRDHGVKTVSLITSMEQPLGVEVGNANEIRESVEVLQGNGPEDVTELTLAFGEVMLELAAIDGGRERLMDAISSGAALQKLREVAEAHGGDPAVLNDLSLLATAPHEGHIFATESGFVTRCDALTIGLAATHLGAGRGSMEDQIDPGVGLSIHAKIGDQVAAGDVLATVRYSDHAKWEDQRGRLSSAWTISSSRVEPPDLIIQRIDATDFER